MLVRHNEGAGRRSSRRPPYPNHRSSSQVSGLLMSPRTSHRAAEPAVMQKSQNYEGVFAARGGVCDTRLMVVAWGAITIALCGSFHSPRKIIKQAQSQGQGGGMGGPNITTLKLPGPKMRACRSKRHPQNKHASTQERMAQGFTDRNLS